MTMKSAPYYWAECDHEDCGARTPDHEVNAYSAADQVDDDARESDWTVAEDGKHFCWDHAPAVPDA